MSITVDESAVKRIEHLRTQQSKPTLKLRITVDSGGCSGFQYKMDLVDSTGPKEQVFDNMVITDNISLNFLKGSVIKFKSDLIGSEFIIENPNAASGCGCGTSFST